MLEWVMGSWHFDENAQHVCFTGGSLETSDVEVIDRTITSLEKRISLVIKNKGERTKY